MNSPGRIPIAKSLMCNPEMGVDMTKKEIKGGFIKKGPKCGYKRCGGTDWIIKGDNTVVCSKCGTDRGAKGTYAYVKDGPKCGYKRCGGTDWFVGGNNWKCTKCGHKR
jgi:hypothetical protein